MAEPEETENEPPKKKGKLPLILGVAFAVLGGVGAFFFMSSSGLEESAKEDELKPPALSQQVSFLELDPILIPLGDGPSNRTLRFQAHLELDEAFRAQVVSLQPRIVDVLNTYLRAVELEKLEDRRALLRLRAQMLRRVQVVTHEVPIRDLLITEFIVN